jgi:predicted Fe-Mo cluster-binding NifX family protein
MKVAVTTAGDDLQAEIDPRFGRAGRLLVYDTESRDYEILENRAGREAAQGAGIQTAKHVVECGATTVITGHCGPNAFRALEAAGVTVVTGVEGRIADALERLAQGHLTPARGADVRGHWS